MLTLNTRKIILHQNHHHLNFWNRVMYLYNLIRALYQAIQNTLEHTFVYQQIMLHIGLMSKLNIYRKLVF